MLEPDAFKLLAHHMYWAGAQGGEQGTDLPNADYVDFVYQTVLGREGEASGVAYWVKELDDGSVARSEFIAVFLTSALSPDCHHHQHGPVRVVLCGLLVSTGPLDRQHNP